MAIKNRITYLLENIEKILSPLSQFTKESPLLLHDHSILSVSQDISRKLTVTETNTSGITTNQSTSSFNYQVNKGISWKKAIEPPLFPKNIGVVKQAKKSHVTLSLTRTLSTFKKHIGLYQTIPRDKPLTMVNVLNSTLNTELYRLWNLNVEIEQHLVLNFNQASHRLTSFLKVSFILFLKNHNRILNFKIHTLGVDETLFYSLLNLYFPGELPLLNLNAIPQTNILLPPNLVVDLLTTQSTLPSFFNFLVKFFTFKHTSFFKKESKQLVSIPFDDAGQIYSPNQTLKPLPLAKFRFNSKLQPLMHYSYPLDSGFLCLYFTPPFNRSNKPLSMTTKHVVIPSSLQPIVAKRTPKGYKAVFFVPWAVFITEGIPIGVLPEFKLTIHFKKNGEGIIMSHHEQIIPLTQKFGYLRAPNILLHKSLINISPP